MKINDNATIHPSASVAEKVTIGKGTNVWQFSVILAGAIIGENCNINAQVFIENDVVIGNRVTVKSGVQLWNGVRVSDDVFIGPNATFTNDLRPRSKSYPEEFLMTEIGKSATIGANATILPGIAIGEYAMVGAGAVVTDFVPERALVVGNPAKIIGWLNNDGSRMIKEGDKWRDNKGYYWIVEENKLIKYA